MMSMAHQIWGFANDKLSGMIRPAWSDDDASGVFPRLLSPLAAECALPFYVEPARSQRGNV